MCQVGEVSVRIAAELDEQGHGNVYIIEGGALGLLEESL